MMLCVVIKGPSFEEAYQQIAKALEYADLVELRLDGFGSLNEVSLMQLRERFAIPMIFTLRGGKEADIRRLAALKPEYLDVEIDLPADFVNEIARQYPEIMLIRSFHDFNETPEDLEGLYQEMKRTPATFYKVAVTPKNCLDALRLICWARKAAGNLIAISMGVHGQISRILAPMIGCPITYASLEEDPLSGLGQLSAKILVERYHHPAINAHTALYALIGDPVEQSVSDETHNQFIGASRFDAVYMKIRVAVSELNGFLNLAKQLPFKGFSVTMPLKEAILPYLDAIDSEALKIGAVNTLLLKTGKITGFNTDGVGALNAIEKSYPVKGKRIVLMGAGGSAKAIAYEAHKRGGIVTILNRDEKKALQVAEPLQGVGKGLEYMAICAEKGYDILINCTPVSPPIDPSYLLPKAIVMDIVAKPKETAFLSQAKLKGCEVIYGSQMFLEQAAGQFALWGLT